MAKSEEDDQFLDMASCIESEYGSVASEGVLGDVAGYVSTGSLSFDALLSGTIFNGGMASNKVLGLAGETSTGKTYFALAVVAKFLKDNPTGYVFYFESETAITTDMLTSRDINTSRVYIDEVATVQEFRTHALRILDKYLALPVEKRKPLLFVLDSLGNLSTDKEIKDISEGKDTRDMTRAQLIRGAFRVLDLRLGKANVPMIITNHTYEVIGSYIPTKKMGGGSGLDYAADIIVFLSKTKQKDAGDAKGKNKNTTGALITAVLKKSRLTIEDKKVDMLLDYRTGLDRYYGLLDIAEKLGIFKKVSNKYEMPDGTKAIESEILRNPEKFYTDEVLKMINEKCADEFLYGKTNVMEAAAE